MILNLKPLNEFVENHHFKMDALESAIRMINPGCYMALIDLKDTYYSVPVAEEHRRYLKSVFNGKLYKYTCLQMVCLVHHVYENIPTYTGPFQPRVYR